MPSLDALLNKFAIRQQKLVHLANFVAGRYPDHSFFIARQWCERQLRIGNTNFIIAIDPSSPSPLEFAIVPAAQVLCIGHMYSPEIPERDWREVLGFCLERDWSGAMDVFLVTELIKRGVSVVVSNVDVVWLRNPGLVHLDSDFANQFYSMPSARWFTEALTKGKLCGNTATGTRCSQMNSDPTCLEDISNFRMYAVKASSASLAIQLRLAKGVLTIREVFSPNWGATPGVVDRALCHDNNAYNLLLASSQKRPRQGAANGGSQVSCELPWRF